VNQQSMIRSDVLLSLHNVSTGCAVFNTTASARPLSGTLFSCSHSTASAFLCHFGITPLISFLYI
jgi:hypothetical protein